MGTNTDGTNTTKSSAERARACRARKKADTATATAAFVRVRVRSVVFEAVQAELEAHAVARAERVAKITEALRVYREQAELRAADEVLEAHGLRARGGYDTDTAALELLDAVNALPEFARATVLRSTPPEAPSPSVECECAPVSSPEDDTGEALVFTGPKPTADRARDLALTHPTLYAVPRRHAGQRVLVLLPIVPADLVAWPVSACGLPVSYVPLQRDGARWRDRVEQWVRAGLVRAAVVCTHGVRGDLSNALVGPLRVASVPMKHAGSPALVSVREALRELEAEAS